MLMLHNHGNLSSAGQNAWNPASPSVASLARTTSKQDVYTIDTITSASIVAGQTLTRRHPIQTVTGHPYNRTACR